MAKNLTSLKESGLHSHQMLLLSLHQLFLQLLQTHSLLPHFLPLKFLFIPDLTLPEASGQSVLLEISFTLEKAANWCHSAGVCLSLGLRLGNKRGRKSNLSLTALSLQAWCRDRGGRDSALVNRTSGEGSGVHFRVERWVREPLLVCSRM